MMSPAAFGSWDGTQREKPEIEIPASGQEKIDQRMAEIRADFIEEYGFMPVCINPDGTPRRKEQQ